MNRLKFLVAKVILISMLAVFPNCKNGDVENPILPKDEVKEILSGSLEIFETNYKVIISTDDDSTSLPSGCNENRLAMTKPEGWVSGFFPGSLWYLFELTGDEYWKQNAEKYTEMLAGEQYNKGTHDLGFMMFDSYGNGYRITKNEAYVPILLQSAESLASRYNKNTGVIKSWDFRGWWEQYPVIVDNMMNLELLMWASEKGGNEFYKDVAISHAENTIKNHFIDGNIAYHVVDYDTITGEALSKGTFQGYADSSAWARGQAWALYGFTYMYKVTQKEIFLEQAKRVASYFLNNLPEDYVPYWDFLAPEIPNEPKDASAAAVAAAALIELSQLTNNEPINYLDYSEKILLSLHDNYIVTPEDHGCGFVIKHSVVSKPHNAGVDVYLNYADYYYLEACKKYLEL